MASASRKVAAKDSIVRTLFFSDSHYGNERVAGVTRPIHDRKAHEVMLKVASDFKPDVIINGGDGLDLGAISHHNAGKNHTVEGFRLLKDAEAYRKEVLVPLEMMGATAYYYLLANHCAWLGDIIEKFPALEGLLTIDDLLKLSDNGWDVIPQGAPLTLGGRLFYLHGDTIKGGQHFSKWAVEAYQRSVIFGHFHSSQRFTKHNALDATDLHRGFAIGCLCRRDPKYGKGAPNKWNQSIALIEEDAKTGQFQVHEVDIHSGKAIWMGKRYVD
jgi:hypothetical protein